MRYWLTHSIALVSTAAAAAGNAEAQRDARDASPLPGRVVDIAAGEFFLQSPDSLPAGLTTFRLRQIGRVARNTGLSISQKDSLALVDGDPTHGFHMLWIVRLAGNKTPSDLLRSEQAGEPTPWATALGGPGFVYPPRTTNATLQLAPGRYALVCYVGSRREDRRRYHLLKGMIRPLTVVPGNGNLEPMPEPGVIVRIVGPDTLEFSQPMTRAGRWLVQVENHSQARAELPVRRLLPGSTIAAAIAWRRRDATPPPHEPWAGLSSIAPGQTLQTTIDLVPGRYLIGRTPIVIRAARAGAATAP